MFDKQESIDELLRLADSWNGYERERAVCQLGLIGNSIAIPMLIKRANDWVPQVRAASYKALKDLLIEENSLAFVDALPKIYHLESCYRDDHRELIKVVESFLLSEENKAKVVSGCISLNPFVARCCLKLTIEHQLLQPHQIVLHCIESHDVVIRSTVANLFKLLTDDQLKEVMESGLKDPFMPVRRETLLLSLSRFPDDSVNLLELFAFDRQASIREIVVKKLVEIGVDIQNLYLQKLSVKQSKLSQLRSALLGLSENNCISAISTILEYLSSEYPSLRKASLQALVRLDQEKAKQYLTVGIRDVSPSVAKESARLMQKSRIRLSEPELIDLCSADSSAVMKSCALSLNRIRNKWDKLSFLIWLANPTNSNKFTQQVDMEIGRWIVDYNRSFVTQTKYQTETLKSRIHELPGYETNEIFKRLKPYL
jgi:HEAT repeat protein